MEALILEQEKLAKGGNLGKSLEDVQKTIDLLVNAREAIAASTSSSPLNVDRLPQFTPTDLRKHGRSQQCWFDPC